MGKTTPLIPRAAKAERVAKPKRERMSRTERAQRVADLCPAGWDLLTVDAHVEGVQNARERFQCVCGGWGKSGYILMARGPVSPDASAETFYSPADLPDEWQAVVTAPIVKVGRSCLYHFWTGHKVNGEPETVEDVFKRTLAG